MEQIYSRQQKTFPFCNRSMAGCAMTEVYTLTFSLQAYAELIRCPANTKQLDKRCCCCWCYIAQFVFDLCSFWYSFQCSSCTRFIYFHLQFVFVRSINQVVFVNSLYPVKLDFVRRLLYTCCTFVSWIHCATAAWFHIYRMLIVLPVEVAIDTHINKTTPTAISRKQSFRRNIRWILFCRLTVQLRCFVLFCIGLNSILNSKSFLDLMFGRGTNIFGLLNRILCELLCRHLHRRLGLLIVI